VYARAYGVNKSATTSYPVITTTDQTQLRRILRAERHMEFANEGLRYMDFGSGHLPRKSLMKGFPISLKWKETV